MTLSIATGEDLNAISALLNNVRESVKGVSDMIAAIQVETLRSQLDAITTRVDGHDSVINAVIESMQRQFTEMTSRLAALETPPTPPPPDPPVDPDPPVVVPDPVSKKLFDPSKLKLIGGWRVDANGYSDSLVVRTLPSGNLQFSIGFGVPQGSGMQHYEVTTKISNSADPKTWSITGNKGAIDNFRSGQGLYYDAVNSRYIGSDDGGYITSGFNGSFFRSSDGGEWNLKGLSNPQARTFGGGFCDIPEPYASKLHGSWGIGQGGYESGQGSSAGPSFAVAKMPAKSDTSIECTPLIQFGDFGTKDKSLRERRPADYSKPLWSPDPDGDIGYWATDRVYSMTWIDGEKYHGLAYLTIQGCGPLDYARQSATFGETTKLRIYVYDPEDLVKVKLGSLKPSEIHGKYYDFPDQNARAFCWSGNRLYVMCNWVWGGPWEFWPIVKVYELGE